MISRGLAGVVQRTLFERSAAALRAPRQLPAAAPGATNPSRSWRCSSVAISSRPNLVRRKNRGGLPSAGLVIQQIPSPSAISPAPAPIDCVAPHYRPNKSATVMTRTAVGIPGSAADTIGGPSASISVSFGATRPSPGAVSIWSSVVAASGSGGTSSNSEEAVAMSNMVASAAARLLVHFPPPAPRVCGPERDVLHRTMSAFPATSQAVFGNGEPGARCGSTPLDVGTYCSSALGSGPSGRFGCFEGCRVRGQICVPAGGVEAFATDLIGGVRDEPEQWRHHDFR